MRSKKTLFFLGVVLLISIIAYMVINPSIRAHILPISSSATGDMLDFFVYNAPSGEEKHIYSRFSETSYTFESGDFVEYDVQLLEKIAGAGGIEIVTTDGSTFRDANGWVDQNGISGHPAADLSEYSYRKWYHRIFPVPATMVGKTANQWALAGENDDDSRIYRAQYANINVTDGKGAIKKGIFRISGDFHWDALRVIDSINTGSASLSPVAKNGGPAGEPRVITPVFPSDDIVVASFVATQAPYGADSTGTNDSTAAIQQALTDCYNSGGGAVWLPVGKYRVTGSIHIPAHVTLRGDWRDPDQGTGTYGTVILAEVPSGGENDPGLFRIWGSAGVMGLTIYYPYQSATSPIPYPFTFEILGGYLGGDGYMSSSVQNVTLLNSYLGISAGKDATHEIHTISNVKGTVLALGIYLQDTADVGKVERIILNNAYWANLDPSLSETHPNRAEIDAWTRNNGTGLLLGGVEWDQLTEISLSDYSLGIGFVQGRRIESTLMMFDISVENSHVAMQVSNLDNRIGLVVSNGVFHANQGRDPIAIEISNSNGASVIFNNTTIGGGAKTAVEVSGSTPAIFLNCIFDDWTGPYAITATTGTLAVEGSQFLPTLSRDRKGVLLQSGVYSAVLLGNEYSEGGADFLLEDNSSAEVKRQDAGYTLEAHGVENYVWRPTLPRPANIELYNVRLSPYRAKANGQMDDTAAVQSALDDAGRAGGGTVFLPPGIYRISTHLTVPAGVELRGSDDVPHRAMLMGRGTGTVLLAFEARGTPDPDGAAPFIFLNGTGAGVRGLSIHYPEQATDVAENIAAYPWTIRGSGDSVYVYDIALSNAWRAVDFATYPTDHHYVSQVVGLALNEGIRVGNSAEGWVEDCLFNINAWSRARGLPGILDEKFTLFRVAGKYTRENLKAFVITTGAENEHLLSNFVYGAHVGFTFESSANAVAINIAADGGVDTLSIKGTGQEGVKVINSEGCGCGLEGVGLRVSGGTVRVWNLITMEPYELAIKVTGGDVLLQGAAFHHGFSRIENGTVTMNGVLFRDAGDHVVIQGGSVNLWGNMGGRTSFKIIGVPASEGCNIRR
jgi:Pectate lyase superfamily protein